MPEETVEKPTVVKVSELSRERSAHFVSAYANHAEGFPGFYDVAIMFCQIVVGTQGKPIVEHHATITFSWEHAIRLRDLLTRLIERYERDHGKIRSAKEPPETPTEE